MGTDTCAGATVLPGNTCTIIVILTPTAGAGVGSVARNGTLTIRSNGSTSPELVALTATVVQAVVGFSVPPTPVLTTSPANATVKNGTITVTNSGGEALTLTAAPTITKTAGPAEDVFAIVTGGSCVAGHAVAAGGNCTILVQYTPGATAPGNVATSTAHVTLADTGAATTTQNSAGFTAN
jgi:hypothetical protein